MWQPHTKQLKTPCSGPTMLCTGPGTAAHLLSVGDCHLVPQVLGPHPTAKHSTIHARSHETPWDVSGPPCGQVTAHGNFLLPAFLCLSDGQGVASNTSAKHLSVHSGSAFLQPWGSRLTHGHFNSRKTVSEVKPTLGPGDLLKAKNVYSPSPLLQFPCLVIFFLVNV